MNETLRDAVVKTVLPPALRSELAHEVAAPIYQRSVFLAGDAQASMLQKVNDGIIEIVKGNHTEEGMRSLLQRLPEIISNKALAVEYRMRLILETNVDLARGYGGWLQTQNVDVLDEYPAWEFYRSEERKEIRDWPARWEEAGGEFYPGASDYPEGRMIALKNDPIWAELSEFGTPYAPFDFNSGMDLQDVDRAECESLGLIEPKETVQPESLDFNDGIESTPAAEGGILNSLNSYLISQQVGKLIGGALRFITP